MDIVGPLSKSSAGYQYLLVIIDYATRFLEVLLMRSVTGHQVAEELMKQISQITYRPGKPNTVADFLSRCHKDEDRAENGVMNADPVVPKPQDGHGLHCITTSTLRQKLPIRTCLDLPPR
ncbi:hypothetical protein Y1Q_0014018 [Alligator mississippiensis]|uniref:Integrase catalytic domain-containing protein n=1 Tax=Alligator mississippiensis TaxID=8496 RepID=A0A151PDN4_ALLMI|nr:hypothetical protein Y1Q_0014018 [Alligator mississippiensis]